MVMAVAAVPMSMHAGMEMLTWLLIGMPPKAPDHRRVVPPDAPSMMSRFTTAACAVPTVTRMNEKPVQTWRTPAAPAPLVAVALVAAAGRWVMDQVANGGEIIAPSVVAAVRFAAEVVSRPRRFVPSEPPMYRPLAGTAAAVA